MGIILCFCHSLQNTEWPQLNADSVLPQHEDDLLFFLGFFPLTFRTKRCVLTLWPPCVSRTQSSEQLGAGPHAGLQTPSALFKILLPPSVQTVPFSSTFPASQAFAPSVAPDQPRRTAPTSTLWTPTWGVHASTWDTTLTHFISFLILLFTKKQKNVSSPAHTTCPKHFGVAHQTTLSWAERSAWTHSTLMMFRNISMPKQSCCYSAMFYTSSIARSHHFARFDMSYLGFQ